MCSKCSKKAGGCDVLLCFFGLEPRNKCPLPGPPVTHSPGTPSDVEGPRHQGLSGFMPGRGCTCRVWSTAGVEHWRVIGMVTAQVFLPTSLGDLDSSLSKRVSGGHIPALDCLFLLREPATFSPASAQTVWRGLCAGLSHSCCSPKHPWSWGQPRLSSLPQSSCLRRLFGFL